jgi:hypothetical protein
MIKLFVRVYVNDNMSKCDFKALQNIHIMVKYLYVSYSFSYNI